MGDFDKAVASAREAQAANCEIDDATARVIASMYHEGQASVTYSFTSTGAVTDPTDVYWEAFPDYNALSAEEKLLADMFGTYLMVCGARPPVAGWSRLWL